MKLKKCFMMVFILFTLVAFVSCNETSKAIELMGAGDRIHDTFTFANVGVTLSSDGENNYTVSGSVKKLTDANVKNEFDIASDVDYVVAIKLSAGGQKVEKNNVQISVNGARNYDAEHLNGSNYTYILLECVAGSNATISVKWSADSQVMTYVVHFDENINFEQ